jgi:hypothetical protein
VAFNLDNINELVILYNMYKYWKKMIFFGCDNLSVVQISLQDELKFIVSLFLIVIKESEFMQLIN